MLSAAARTAPTGPGGPAATAAPTSGTGSAGAGLGAQPGRAARAPGVTIRGASSGLPARYGDSWKHVFRIWSEAPVRWGTVTQNPAGPPRIFSYTRLTQRPLRAAKQMDQAAQGNSRRFAFYAANRAASLRESPLLYDHPPPQ